MTTTTEGKENTMSELDTEYVRREFIKGAYSQKEMAREFNKWLDEVCAEAWEEGRDDALRGLDIHGDTSAENPYR